MVSDYERVGEGEHPVIGLHGWFGSATEWRPLQPYLDGSRFHYIFPDCRGYGARKSVAGEHSLAEAAGDVLTLADELGLDRFSLVGHSMGGTVMQRVLADAPKRVRALVGVSPVPAGGVPFDDETQVPVKVIVGEHDPALSEPIMQATFAKWYPYCEIEVFANAGHYPIDETPVALATAIEKFLAGV